MVSNFSENYITYSKYSAFKRCPKILYWQKVKPPEEIKDYRNSLVGNTVHHLTEQYIQGNISLSGLENQVDVSFAHERDDTRKQPVLWRSKKDEQNLHTKVFDHVEHVRQLMQSLSITSETSRSEVKLEHVFGDTKIHGRIDIVTQRRDNLVSVYDLKATEFIKPQDEDQIRVYHALLRRVGVEPIDGGFLFTATGQMQNVVVNEAAEDVLIGNMQRVAAQIKRGDLDATPTKQECGWCPFRKVCPDVWKG